MSAIAGLWVYAVVIVLMMTGLYTVISRTTWSRKSWA